MSSNQAGYATLWATAPPTPLLSPRYHGCEFVDRGACLLQGQGQQPTPLERNNALTAGGVAGYGVTLPRAAGPQLAFTFENTDVVAISIWALPGVENFGPSDWLPRLHPDTIESLANNEPLVLEPGQSVTLTATTLGHWSSSS